MLKNDYILHLPQIVPIITPRCGISLNPTNSPIPLSFPYHFPIISLSFPYHFPIIIPIIIPIIVLQWLIMHSLSLINPYYQ